MTAAHHYAEEADVPESNMPYRCWRCDDKLVSDSDGLGRVYSWCERCSAEIDKLIFIRNVHKTGSPNPCDLCGEECSLKSAMCPKCRHKYRLYRMIIKRRRETHNNGLKVDLCLRCGNRREAGRRRWCVACSVHIARRIHEQVNQAQKNPTPSVAAVRRLCARCQEPIWFPRRKWCAPCSEAVDKIRMHERNYRRKLEKCKLRGRK